MSCFNLIAYCLKRRPNAEKTSFRRWIKKRTDKMGLRKLVSDICCQTKIQTKKLPKRLWEIIFEELLEKSKEPQMMQKLPRRYAQLEVLVQSKKAVWMQL